ELLVGRRFLEGVELGPVEVLQQRITQEDVVLDVAYDRWDRLSAGQLGRPPAPLTHDERVSAALSVWKEPHDERLVDAYRAAGGGQLLELVLVKDLARLPAVGDDLGHPDLGERRTGHWRESICLHRHDLARRWIGARSTRDVALGRTHGRLTPWRDSIL